MKTIYKILFLLGAVIPLIWIGLYLGEYLSMIPIVGQLGFVLLVVLISTIGFLGIISYNKQITRSEKATWILLLLLFGSVTQLAYWFVWVKSVD